jgi:paraquat-inducible protein B
MTDESGPEVSAEKIPQAIVYTKKSFSIVWFVPLVAVLIGAWLVFKALSEQGPTVTITFKTAEGLEAGKTKIKYKSVEVGQVESIDLSEDLSRVLVTAKLVKGAESYLTENTRFWVVRARIAAGEVSGIGTLFSGAYIGLDPGQGGEPTRDFLGLETPPIVTTHLPGRQFTLRSENLGSLDVGSPIYFRQIKVGEVVQYELNEHSKAIILKIFIHAPHHNLVRKNTRFWNAGGIDLTLDARGIKVDTQSIVSIFSGGIAFDTPPSLEPTAPAETGEVFPLYKNREATQEASYTKKTYWVLNFQESVRGLTTGAPVEFRGIKIGEVIDIKVELLMEELSFRISVLIEIEPDRIALVGVEIPNSGKQGTLAEEKTQFIDTLVEKGLRAQLRAGSLLTGQLYIDFDIHPDAPPQQIVYGGEYPEFPTVPAPLERIRTSVTRIINNLERMPIEQISNDLQKTVQGANKLINSAELHDAIEALNLTLKQTQKLAQNLNKSLMPEAIATLKQTRDSLVPAKHVLESVSPVAPELQQTLVETTRAARAIRSLADYLERHPNALLYGKQSQR